MKPWEEDSEFNSKWNQYKTAYTTLSSKTSNNTPPNERVLNLFNHTKILFDDVKQHAKGKNWFSEWTEQEGKAARKQLLAIEKRLNPNQSSKQSKPNGPKAYQNQNSQSEEMKEFNLLNQEILELEEKIKKHSHKDPYGKHSLILKLYKKEEKLNALVKLSGIKVLSKFLERTLIFKVDFNKCVENQDLDSIKTFIQFFNNYPNMDWRNDGLLSGKWRVVKYLLEEGGADINYHIQLCGNIAHSAAKENQPQVLSYLWKNYNQLCLQTTPKGMNCGDETILHMAIRSKSTDAAKTILTFAPDTFINYQEQSGYTPLHHAVYYKQVEIVELLLPHSDLNLRNNDGLTAHQMAIREAKDGLIFNAAPEAKQIAQLFENEMKRRKQEEKSQHSNYFYKIRP